MIRSRCAFRVSWRDYCDGITDRLGGGMAGMKVAQSKGAHHQLLYRFVPSLHQDQSPGHRCAPAIAGRLSTSADGTMRAGAGRRSRCQHGHSPVPGSPSAPRRVFLSPVNAKGARLPRRPPCKDPENSVPQAAPRSDPARLHILRSRRSCRGHSRPPAHAGSPCRRPGPARPHAVHPQLPVYREASSA